MSKNNEKIKCIVWDLDNTLWKGVLLEDENVSLYENAVEVVKKLDKRGILQSVASKNDFDRAMAKIDQFGLKDYFLYPQINWNPKSSSIENIAKSINIGMDTLAFVDDQAFEREEVSFSHPEVLCIGAHDIENMPDMPEMTPRFITGDSAMRREMYLNDIRRNKVEDNFEGPKEEFLSSLEMALHIAPARKDDLQRAEELTVRIHQLNTTGCTYSYDELNSFIKSRDYNLIVASLDDKYGTYGKIGLALIETGEDVWNIKLLLMSCRVMARGVGSVIINYIRNEAKKCGVKLRAEFINTNVNRMMYMTYKFAGFNEIKEIGDSVVFENDLTQIPLFPGYMKVRIS